MINIITIFSKLYIKLHSRLVDQHSTLLLWTAVEKKPKVKCVKAASSCIASLVPRLLWGQGKKILVHTVGACSNFSVVLTVK